MIKNYVLPLIFICFAISFGYGQISNGDFESWTGSIPDNWTTIDAGITTAQETTIVRGGSSSASVNVTTATQGSTDLRQTIPLVNGDNYTVSCWVRHTEGNVRARLYVDSYQGYSANGNTSTWQEITYTFTATSTNIEVGLRFYDQTGFDGAEIVYVDDFTITNNSAPSTTTVQFSTVASTIAEDGLFIDVCASITNPSATATTVDIELDGSSTATNGTDYDDGAATPAAISFPQTLTFPANDSDDKCFTIYISNDDLLIEGDETVVLNLINPTGGDSATLGTNTQHILTITDNDVAAIADVVITEIMYNTPGTDDEWIEICNTSGSTQILNDYTIEVGGFTEFTFPSSGVIIADNDCITVSLGSNGDGTYNNDCPFTPDYGIDAATSNTNNLGNNNETVTLIASDGSTVIDEVFYDDNDESLTDGNGSSFHVIDASLDNSNTDSNWQAVVDGGSPGTNSLVSACSALEPEINIEGDIGAFPDIANGDTTPSFLDNTEFSDQIISSGSQTKSFIIENLGLADLSVSNIEIIGADAADFTVTLPSALPLIITSNTEVTFDVTFAPLSVAGIRNATVRITNNDSADGEGEEIYEFAIRGEAICDAASNVVSPLTGPVNTVVTISGTDLDGSTFVTYDGVTLTHTSISATEIEFSIPSGAISGNIEVTNNLNCQSVHAFTLIDNTISSCEGNGGVTPTDLFISEITDKGTGSHSYIELYNGTGTTVDLTDYEIRIHNNGDVTATSIADLTGSMPNSSTYVVAIGGTNATDPEGGYTADEFYGFGGINDNDNIRLYFNDGINPETWVDLWGDTSGSTFTIASNDYNYRRKNTGITVPSTTWDSNDWDILTPLDYSNIGVFDFSTGVPPTVTLQPVSTAFDCTFSAIYTIAGSEGYNGTSPADTQELTYQWLYNAPGTSTWVEINSGDTNYSGQQSATLTIPDTSNFNGYQYYCQLREDTATCFTASNAVKLEALSSIWDGSSWSTPPSIDRAIIIDGAYDTSVGTNGETSFEACSCTVTNGNELTIEDNNYVLVENNLVVDGSIVVRPYGSFVQVNDAATITGNILSDKTKIRVVKKTATLASHLEYTYWSSPVSGETINDGLAEANLNNVYWYNGQNFLDSTRETNNDNTTVAGQDDIDDDANDWQYASGATVMAPGVGYAGTQNNFTAFPTQIDYEFQGPFNNGVYNVPIYRNDSETNDNNWNFIGNPYPSAIDADLFLAANASIDQNAGAVNGAIFFWSHNTAVDENTNGNEGYNYAQSDYAIINGSGETVGGDGVTPTRHIPSGQGFFVSMDDAAASTVVSGSISTANVVFNNSMRITGDNDQFFRNTTDNTNNRLWLNLTTDNGVLNQTLLAYVNGATDANDGMYYDVERLPSIQTNAIIYTLSDNTNDFKFAIQGKNPNSLTIDEIVPLGLTTSIDEATLYTISIYQFEGAFLTDNTVYLKDNDFNTYHNLTANDYTFTSEPGEFNDRFEIVFTTQALSIADVVIDANTISIVELNDSEVQFKLNTSTLSITNVEILDVLGRRVYNLKGNSATEVYNLSKLSQAAYIAKITLSNGQVISKKAIKK